jgi:hypothetical protein
MFQAQEDANSLGGEAQYLALAALKVNFQVESTSIFHTKVKFLIAHDSICELTFHH